MGAAVLHGALMVLRLSEFCCAFDDGLRRELTVSAGFSWVSFVCGLIGHFLSASAGDFEKSIMSLFRIEGLVQVLSMGVRCNLVNSKGLGMLEATGGCSIAGSLDEQAKRVLHQLREGRWVAPSAVQVKDEMYGCVDQLSGLMRGPFALELGELMSSLLASAPAPAAGAGSKGVVASVAALRAAFAAAKPILDGMAASTPADGQRPLCAVACCNVFCSRGGPALVGGGDAWVGPSDQPFCSRACFAAHIAMCRDAAV